MSCTLTRLVGRLTIDTLKAAPRSVLQTLASYCNDDGSSCYPSLPRIARESCVSVRSAIRHVAFLQQRGYLSREKGAGRRPNAYQLNVEALAAAVRPPWCRAVVVPKVPNVSIDPDPKKIQDGAVAPSVLTPRPIGPKGWLPAPARPYQCPPVPRHRLPEAEPSYHTAWWDDCQRDHGGTCGGQYRHFIRRQIDVARGLLTGSPLPDNVNVMEATG